MPVRVTRVIKSTVPEGKTATVAFTVNDVTIESEGLVINARLVEGRYPNWRQVIPKYEECQLNIEVMAGMLDSAIRQAAITSDNETRGVDFEFKDGTMFASAAAASAGNSKVSMPIAYSGEPLQVKLDFRYVRDFLAVQDPGSMVRLQLNSSTEPALLSCEGYQYVVMPMALER